MNQPNQQQGQQQSHGGQQGRGQQQQKKKRINRIFELVGQHAAEEFAKWQEEYDITPQVIDELITADMDTVDRAYKAGGFKAACRVIIGQTCDRLVQQDKLDPGDPSNLEEVFAKAAEEIAKAETEKKGAEKKQKETTKLNGPAAVEAAIATIGQVCDDRKYNRMYQQRIRELIAGIKKAQKTTFFKNCLVLAQQSNQQYGEGIAVPPLVLSLVQIAWIDDDAERLKSFQNSALMQEVK